MRYCWILALAAAALPAQVLAPAPPPTAFKALGAFLRQPAIRPAPPIPRQAPAPCAIRLQEVPVNPNSDRGIFVRQTLPPAHSAFIVEPPAPPCPKDDPRP